MNTNFLAKWTKYLRYLVVLVISFSIGETYFPKTLASVPLSAYGLIYDSNTILNQPAKSIHYFNSQIQLPSLNHQGYFVYMGFGSQKILPSNKIFGLYIALGYDSYTSPEKVSGLSRILYNVGFEYLQSSLKIINNIYLSTLSSLHIDLQASYKLLHYYIPFVGTYYLKTPETMMHGFMMGIAIRYLNWEIQLKQIWGQHASKGLSLNIKFNAYPSKQMTHLKNYSCDTLERFIMPIIASPDRVARALSRSTRSLAPRNRYSPPIISDGLSSLATASDGRASSSAKDTEDHLASISWLELPSAQDTDSYYRATNPPHTTDHSQFPESWRG